jgi:hypothetical protein
MPLLSVGLLQASCSGFAIAMAGSLVWGNEAMQSKYREIGGVLALGGCHFMMQYNKSVFAVLMMREQRRGQGGAYGGAPWHCFGRRTSNKKNIQSKIWHDLRWLAFDDAAHNNQPKTCGHDGAGLREEVRPGGHVQGE